MFINTVIVFLRDMLPIFILFAYLTALMPNQQTHVIRGMLIGIAVGVQLLLLAEPISEIAEGMGSELVKIFLAVMGYMAFVAISFEPNSDFSKRHFSKTLVIGTVCFVSMYLSGFLIYINSHLGKVGSSTTLIMACVIGAGIGLSFATLYRFILRVLIRHNNHWLVVLLWSLFIAGFVSQSYSYLAQIDLVSIGLERLELGAWINESSEYGHLFKATIGFELSPATGQFYLYLMAALLPWMLWQVNRHSSDPKGEV